MFSRMKLDSSLPKDLPGTERLARELEEAGYDGIWIGETNHDPFLQVLRASEGARTIQIGTAIAIAFARTPMTTAHLGYDLAEYTGGRFALGLGSQVKAHIERRYSMPWSHPAARMREFVLALRAIWSAWQDGTPLAFDGDYYHHTLMTPFFSPERHAYGPPPVLVAAVGERMTEVAGEVADGLFFHAFSTRRYLEEVTFPALRRGWAAGGRSAEGFDIVGPTFVTAGRTPEELDVAIRGTKDQIAFYASTPAYRPVLDLHGWGDLQPELTSLSKQGRWSEMGGLIDDSMLAEFSVVGTPEVVGRGLRDRYEGVATRIRIYATYDADPAMWPALLDAARR
jgi:probable F420-dependent oxidoreductase